MPRTSIIDHRSRALQRFDRLVRQVTWHADDTEIPHITKVVDAVGAGAIHVRDAHATLSALRLQQQARAQAAA